MLAMPACVHADTGNACVCACRCRQCLRVYVCVCDYACDCVRVCMHACVVRGTWCVMSRHAACSSLNPSQKLYMRPITSNSSSFSRLTPPTYIHKHTPIQSLSHARTHALTHPPTHPLTHSLTCQHTMLQQPSVVLLPPLTHPPTHTRTYARTCQHAMLQQPSICRTAAATHSPTHARTHSLVSMPCSSSPLSYCCCHCWYFSALCMAGDTPSTPVLPP